MKFNLGLVIFISFIVGIFVYLHFFPSTIKNVSTVQFEIKDKTIFAKFNISSQDKNLAKQFSDNLGISTSWEEGISIDLDEGTIQKLRNYLPQDLKLSFSPKQLIFSSDNMVVNNDLISASSSGDILISSDSAGYNIEIDNPGLALNKAVSNGEVKLSPKLSNIWQLLGKLAKINLRVNKSSLNGVITLN